MFNLNDKRRTDHIKRPKAKALKEGEVREKIFHSITRFDGCVVLGSQHHADGLALNDGRHVRELLSSRCNV